MLVRCSITWKGNVVKILAYRTYITPKLPTWQIPLWKEQIIETNPEVLNGTPVFKSTCVPVQALIDYLKTGESIENFLDGFPNECNVTIKTN